MNSSSAQVRGQMCPFSSNASFSISHAGNVCLQILGHALLEYLQGYGHVGIWEG